MSCIINFGLLLKYNYNFMIVLYFFAHIDSILLIFLQEYYLVQPPTQIFRCSSKGPAKIQKKKICVGVCKKKGFPEVHLQPNNFILLTKICSQNFPNISLKINKKSVEICETTLEDDHVLL